MKLLLGLGVKLGFVPIFRCPAPRASSPLPVLGTFPSQHCYNTQKIIFCTHKTIHLVLIIVD